MNLSARELVDDHLRWLDVAPSGRRREAPVDALQAVALADPDPYVRTRCLGVLDHVANEASTHVFLAALADPIADVRRSAVHGLTCERCRPTEVCVADVVPAVTAALAAEPDAEIRHSLVVALGRFVSRSDAAKSALDAVAEGDADPLVRTAATSVLATGHTRGRKALQRLASTESRRARR